jgi:hypothetical protein
MTFPWTGAFLVFVIMVKPRELQRDVLCKPRRIECCRRQSGQCKTCANCPSSCRCRLVYNKVRKYCQRSFSIGFVKQNPNMCGMRLLVQLQKNCFINTQSAQYIQPKLYEILKGYSHRFR